MLKRMYLIGLLCCFTVLLNAQQYTISGYIESADAGEKLIGVNVYDLVSGEGTVSNDYGFYSLTLDRDSVAIVYSYVGFHEGVQSFFLDKDKTLDVALLSGEELEEVVITARNEQSIADKTEMSTIDIPVEQIKKIPPLLGEVDVIKALQLLPGVQSGGEGQSGLYVRGGSPDQNLILLDGVPVYNVSHLFGFFSVFNADAIKDVQLVKGGYPARFGGRLSSVLNIRMKEGNMQEFHGSASVGLISSKATIEGPLWKGKTSFMVTGRRTYIDVLARPIIKNSLKKNGTEGATGYYFYDVNAKVNHRFSDKDRLYLSYYGGNDKFYLDTKRNEGDVRTSLKNNFGWGNHTAALRWNHLWTDKLFSNATATFSRYNLGLGSGIGQEGDSQEDNSFFGLSYDSGIEDYALGIDFDYIPTSRHFIRFGARAIRHRFIPGEFKIETKIGAAPQFKQTIGQSDIYANEYALYVEDDYKISEALKANVGLHFSGFEVGKSFYTSVQPRLSLRYKVMDNFSIKTSFTTMRQYINLLSFEGIGLPTDLWLPSTEKIKPQESWQVALGGALQLSSDTELNIEGYYKKMQNLISYKEGEGAFGATDWQTRVTQGDGESYGAEVFLQQKYGKLSGWIGYTLSWTNRTFDELNFGKPFDYRYDRRHDLSIVTSYQLSDRWDMGVTWVYGTGNAVTLGESRVVSIFGDRFFNGFDYPQRNGYRMPAYHRLDVGFNYVKKRKNRTGTFSFGAYNAYNRKNPFYLYTEASSKTIDGVTERKTILKQASLFPVIPYINYKIDF